MKDRKAIDYKTTDRNTTCDRRGIRKRGGAFLLAGFLCLSLFVSAGGDGIGEVNAAQPVGKAAEAVQSQSGTAYFSDTGALHVEGAKLVDKKGTPVQLKGISTHGIAWFPGYVNQDCFRTLRQDWGANAVRLSMYTAEYGGYCTGGDKTALKKLVRDGVRYAAAEDLYVLIDWHILSDGNPNTYKAEAKTFFSEMAEEFAGQGNVIYEICNEPNGATSWKDIKNYAQEVIPAIRRYDPDAVIIVGTPNWSQYVDQAAADPIKGQKNIMYALHFYAATHKDDLRNKMVNAVKSGLPVFVTEYGICDASGSGAIDRAQADAWVSLLDQYQVSYIAWNLSNKAETSAILKSSCTKTAAFTANDLSPAGMWLLNVLSGKSQLTPASTQASAPVSSAVLTAGQGSAFQTVPAVTGQGSAPAAGKRSWTARLINKWVNNGESYYQYDFTITNRTGGRTGAWIVTIPLSESGVITDCWNGRAVMEGKNIKITSMEYNGALAPGDSVTGVGVIVKGSGALTVK